MKKILNFLKNHEDTTIFIIFAAIAGPLFLIWALVDNNAQSQVDEMLASSDPVGQLIAAIDSNQLFVEGWAIKTLDEIGDPLLLALAPACSGEIVSTSPYDPNVVGPHPFVLLSPGGGSHNWTYTLLKDRGPESRQAQDVQLVICASETRRKLETCEYVGLKIIRVQQVLTLSVIEAATGNLVDRITYEGSKPGGCTLNPSGSGTRTKKGSYPVKLSEAEKWLENFYE